MITPEEIRKKAGNRYREVLKAWLLEGNTNELFPMEIRFRHVKASDELTAVATAVAALRKQSKAETGNGYTVVWREIGSRTLGKNQFPDRIVVETLADFLATTGETGSFERFVSTATSIRREFPELEPWLRREIKLLLDIADDGHADGLLAVSRYLADHPRCGLFSRELPVAVDTKFVERHATKILRPWLDLILPPSEIRADEKHFERRIGLGYAEPLIRIRFLDPDLQQSLGFQFNELALPLAEASRAFELGGVNPKPKIYVVENLVNALTLPAIEGAVALAGLGYSVNLFRYLSWLHECPEIRYWGDIDAQGFEILSQFRSWFPQTRSLMMNREVFDEFSEFRVAGQPPRSSPPSNLTAAEAKLNEECRRDNVRLEQEKIWHAWVIEQIQNAEG